MKQPFKKRLVLVLVVCLVMMMAAACTNNSNKSEATNSPESTSTPASTSTPEKKNEVVDLTWFVNSAGAAWKDFEGTVNEKYLMDNYGVRLKFVTPVTNDNAQLNTMIAGDKLPDLISVQSWFPEVSKMADQGYLYAINDLMDKYDKDMLNEVNKQKDVFTFFQRPDGKTYGLPNFAYSSTYLQGDSKLVPNGGILIRKDYQEWYLKQNPKGSDPNDPDYISKPAGFIKMCEAVKIQYYKSGQPVVQLDQGISGSITWLSQYFASPYESKDGKYLDRSTQPLMKEAREFINTLYNKKLISAANMSENRDQVANNISNGIPFVSMVTPQNYSKEFWNAYDTKKVEYQAFVLRNSKGDQPVLQDIRGFGYLLTMVNKKTKYPEQVIKLMHFLYSEEGQRFTQFGIEGKTWEWAEQPAGNNLGKIKYTDEFIKARDNKDTAKYGFGPSLLQNFAYIRLVQPDQTSDPQAKYINNLKLPLSPYTADYNPAFFVVDGADPDYSKYQDIAGKIKAVWDQYNGLLVTSKNFAADYDKVMGLLKQEGLDFNVQIDSKYYEKWKQKMGYKYGWPANDPTYKTQAPLINGDPSWLEK
jgi:putative aldouronate transport system substrate-binding protein